MKTIYIWDRDRFGAGTFIRRNLGPMAGDKVAMRLCARELGRFLVYPDFELPQLKPGKPKWSSFNTPVEIGLMLAEMTDGPGPAIKIQHYVQADAEAMILEAEQDAKERGNRTPAND